MNTMRMSVQLWFHGTLHVPCGCKEKETVDVFPEIEKALHPSNLLPDQLRPQIESPVGLLYEETDLVFGHALGNEGDILEIEAVLRELCRLYLPRQKFFIYLTSREGCKVNENRVVEVYGAGEIDGFHPLFEGLTGDAEHEGAVGSIPSLLVRSTAYRIWSSRVPFFRASRFF